MKLRYLVWTLCILGLAASCSGAALADPGEAQSLNATLVQPANAALRAELDAEKAQRAREDGAKQTAQARPIGEREATVHEPGLVKGFSYTLDLSAAYPLGNTGYKRAALPGGLDAVAAYGFTHYLRAYVGYFQVQEYPLGFDTGKVPVYLQGLAPPIAVQDLHAEQIDVTSKDKFLVALVQNLLVVGKHAKLPIPIIISPGYVSRTANVAGGGDLQLVEINGFPQLVHFRTNQVKLVAFTVPLVSSPRFFASLTAAPAWNLNLNGANTTNHAQLLQVGYVEYRLDGKTTLFFQPSLAPSYLPADPYPQHLATFIYGITHSFTKNTFVQSIISSGTPANRPDLGITSLTCQRLPCPQSEVAPAIGGLRATQVQVLFGVGTPSTIPL